MKTNFVLAASVLKWVGAAFAFGAVLVIVYLAIADSEGLPRRYWARYVVYLERKLRRMFDFTSGELIAIGQLVAIAACFALYVTVDLPLWYGFAAIIAIAPAAWIERARRQRVAAIEAQIDGFVLAMANALKATPSLGDAFKSVALLARDPIRQEMQLAVKEMRVGATLDQALLLMASRVGSRQLDSALSSILIGRRVGGNLPKILETTAMSLREMARLEGVVRTKTAEGKMQLWVLAVFPLLMIFALSSVAPGYFDPMTDSFVGYVLIVLAVGFWGASLVAARKILAVDI